MSARLALIFLTVAPPLMLLACAVSLPGGELLFGVLAVAFPFALIVLGARRTDGGLGALRLPLLALILWYELCAAGMMLLRGHIADGPWFAGLPLATAIQVYAVFLLPMLPVALIYARTFDRDGLRPEDLEDLRRRFPRQD